MDKQLLRQHVESCPLGWHDGMIVAHRNVTDAEVIEWLAVLRDMVGLSGIERPDSASEESK